MSELRVAELGHDDLAAVAELHASAFSDSAITAFGPGAICRYYTWLLDGPHDAALVGAWQGSTLIGFCAAGSYYDAMNGFLRANRWYLLRCLVSQPKLVWNPVIRSRLGTAMHITARFSRLVRRRSSSRPYVAPRFGVLSIATDLKRRGQGAGRALMLDAEQRARARGHTQMILTVHPDNHRAVDFYESLGWLRCWEADGRWHGLMRRELGPS